MTVFITGRDADGHQVPVAAHKLWGDSTGINWALDNADRVFGLLDLPEPNELSIAACRRCVMQARARFDRVADDYTREEVHREYPGGGSYHSPALTKDDLRERMELFASFVEAADKAGATTIVFT